MTATGSPARLVRVLAAPLITLAVACAQEPPKPVVVEETQEVKATVEAIDVKSRMLSLRRADGSSLTMQVDPAVRNLPQVKVGDQVVARYYQALGAELKARGAQGPYAASAPEVSVAVGRAEPGARPAGVVGTQTKMVVRISSIDTTHNVVSFFGQDGLIRAFPVVTPQGREFIRKLKPGDQVEVTYTEALAIGVEPAK